VTLHFAGEQSSSLRSSNLKVGLFTIVKNEAPYIEEWIAHHRASGCTHIFVADNGSDDGCRERLQALQESKLCRFIDFPSPPDRPPQVPAYEELVARFAAQVDWMAFVDADEFIVTDKAFESIRDFVSAFHAMPEVGAIALNWACYGSSGKLEYEEGFVVERFERRAEQNAFINHHYKSIVRSAAFAGTGGNPHHFRLKDGFSYVTADGEPLRLMAQRGAGLSASVVWTNARINHYVVKSRQEFFEKKAARGRAALPGPKRGEPFFIGHDRNDVHEPFPDHLLQRLQRVHSQVLHGSADPGYSASYGEAEKPMIQSGLGEAPQRRFYRSVVDTVERVGTDLCIKGWAISSENLPVADLELRVGERSVATEIIGMSRSDVLRSHPEASGDVGFLIKASLLDPDVVTSLPVELWTDGALLGRVPIPDELQWSADTLPKLRRPAMPAPCVERLKDALADATLYLEYGSGGSTTLAASNPGLSIISVDSDWKLLRCVKLLLAEKGALERTILKFVDLGPVGENGYPVGKTDFGYWHHYAMGPWIFCEEKNLAPDLILIDGRFRRACTLASLIFAAPGTRLLFDDYLDRDHYHSIERHVSPVNCMDRMAEFVRPSALDETALWIDLMEAVCDPR